MSNFRCPICSMTFNECRCIPGKKVNHNANDSLEKRIGKIEDAMRVLGDLLKKFDRESIGRDTELADKILEVVGIMDEMVNRG